MSPSTRASRQASANAVALSSWDSTQLVAPSAEASSALKAGALPHLAVYEGAGQRRYLDAATASRIAELRLEALELGNKTFSATSSARHVGAGCTFSLTQHERYPESGGANQFKVLSVSHSAANNLPAQVAQLLQSVGFQARSGNHSGVKSASSPINTRASSSQKHSGQQQQDETDPNSLTDLPRGTYRNRFTAVRAVVPVVPAAINAPLTATAPGPQTAIVVGLAGEQLTTERNHSIRVQFAWQRGTSPLPGGLSELNSPDPASQDAASNVGNAPGNETSGTWVRVAEALAGPNWGSQFTPRIGTEVLIDFIDGDMDQPVVVAQLYNGVDTPPFAAGVRTACDIRRFESPELWRFKATRQNRYKCKDQLISQPRTSGA